MAKQHLTSSAEFLKSIRDVAFVIAVYLYFAGWVYIYTYFNFFGISLSQAGIEFYYFLIYSVNVMTFLIIDHWFVSSCFVLACIAAVHWARHAWVVYVISILMFAALYYSAILAGARDARTDFAYYGSSLLKVKFVLKNSDTLKKKTDGVNENKKLLAKTPDITLKAPPCLNVKGTPVQKAKQPPVLHYFAEDLTGDFATYNSHDKLRLMLETKDEYIVLVADSCATYENAFEEDKDVYIISKDKIDLAKTTK